MLQVRKGLALVGFVAAMLGGGAIGAIAFGATGTGTTATTTTTSSSSSSGGFTAASPSGTFHPNEDAAHEAGESAEREAQEDAGQVPTVP